MKGDKEETRRSAESDRADNNRQWKIAAVRRVGIIFDKIENELESGTYTIEISANTGTVVRVFHGNRLVEIK